MLKNINQKELCQECEPEGMLDHIAMLLSANAGGYAEIDAADDLVTEPVDKRLRGPKDGYRDVEDRNERRSGKQKEIA